MAAAAILDFQFMWIWPFLRVDSVVFVFCTKFGSNICYSHWDRRTYASEINLMTLHELTSGFDFWSRGHLRMAAMHLPIKFGAYVLIHSGVIDIFPKFRWRQPPSWIFRLCEFGHSVMLIVWYLCSVPNLFQISVIVTEIDALILQTFIWWRHANNFRFRRRGWSRRNFVKMFDAGETRMTGLPYGEKNCDYMCDVPRLDVEYC